MLQKAMKLKQKNNLEPLKCNSFASLHTDSLQQLAKDVKIQLGVDSLEAHSIIDKLVVEEVHNVNRFVEENPEILLPVDLEIEQVAGEVMEQAVVVND
jgi:ApbE superfamily uncharacterized protein (UPF0280 family)